MAEYLGLTPVQVAVTARTGVSFVYRRFPLVTVYSKPNCVQCNATYRALDDKGIPYTVIDMSQDPEALAAVKELGYLQAPVVVLGQDHWSGFRPDKIAQIESGSLPGQRT